MLKEAAKPTWDEMLKILRDDKSRSYHIDVESDSTVFEDAAGERKARMEFVNAMGAYLESALPIIQVAPELTPMVFEALEFMVKGFKIGRTFEDIIEETKENILASQEAAKQQQQQQAPPDPKMIDVQQKGQAKQAELQMQGQMGWLWFS